MCALTISEKWREIVLRKLKPESFDGAKVVCLTRKKGTGEFVTPDGQSLESLKTYQFLNGFYAIDTYKNIVEPLENEVGATIEDRVGFIYKVKERFVLVDFFMSDQTPFESCPE